MILGGLQKVTLIDYPGKLATTLFTCGCPFRCPWCYSPELVLPEKIEKQPKISEKYFFDFLKERKGFLEGVVLCGGEPTINEDLPQFIEKIKNLGYCVKIDTNGSNPQMLKKLIDAELVDYIAMDVKAPLEPQKYFMAIGVEFDLEKIKESIRIIKNSNIDYEFRTTLVPSIHTKEDILEIAKEISPAKKYFLQNFRPEKTLNPAFEKIKPFPSEFLIEIQKEISSLFEICQIR